MSHQLHKYQTFDAAMAAASGTAAGAGTAVRDTVFGHDALGPIAWTAPEVLAGNQTDGVTTTPASDVYMLGGLMFEVLTCGERPYYWMRDVNLLSQRRAHAARELFRPDGTPGLFAGLLGLSVVDAAAVDEIDVPWRIRDGGASGRIYGTVGCMGRLKALMTRCLDSNAHERPKLEDVLGNLLEMMKS